MGIENWGLGIIINPHINEFLIIIFNYRINDYYLFL